MARTLPIQVIAAQVILLLRRPELGKEIRAALRFAGKKIVGDIVRSAA